MKKPAVIDNFLKKPSTVKERFGISAIWTIFLLVSSWLLWGIQLAENDDGGMMYYISGAMSGQPEPYVYFTGPLFSVPLAWLYKLTDALPWYILSYLVLCALSCWMICQMLLKNCVNWQQKVIRLGLFTALYGCLYARFSVRPQFTTVSAICGAVAIGILLTGEATDGKGEKCLNAVALVLFSLMAINIRLQVGMVVVAIIVCTVILQVVQKKRNFAWGATILVGIALLYGVTQLVIALYQADGWSYYLKFNPALGRFIDYPIAPYAEMREVYESIGWDEPLYNIVKYWFFLDHRCTYEAFETLAQANAAWLKEGNRLWSFLVTLKSWSMFKALCCLGAPVAWCGLSVLQAKDKKAQLWQSLGCVCYAVGGVALLFYFTWQGRIPQRIIDMSVCLSLTPCLIALPQWEFMAKCSVKQKKCVAWVTVACFVSMMTVLCVRMPQHITNHTEHYQQTALVENYCAEHPEYLFLNAGCALEKDAFTVHTMSKAQNCIFWGGSLYPSPLYLRQLQSNGYEQFDESNLFDENVRFIGLNKPRTLLTDYLETLYPTARCVLTDEYGPLKIYKFVK